MVLQKLKYFHLDCVVVESCATKLKIRHMYRQGNAVRMGITVTNYMTDNDILLNNNIQRQDKKIRSSGSPRLFSQAIRSDLVQSLRANNFQPYSI